MVAIMGGCRSLSSDVHGGLRRRASSQSQAPDAWARNSAYAREVHAPVLEGQKNDFRDAEAGDAICAYVNFDLVMVSLVQRPQSPMPELEFSGSFGKGYIQWASRHRQ